MTNSVTTSTSTVSVNNLVSASSVMYIRPIVLTLTVNGCRPNTIMNVFFDSVYMNHFVTPIDSSALISTSQLITDTNGYINFTLAIPGGTFSTGSKTILITDAPSIEILQSTGSTYGGASTTFLSTGETQVFQTITTTTSQNTVVTDQYLEPIVTTPVVVIPPPVVVPPVVVPIAGDYSLGGGGGGSNNGWGGTVSDSFGGSVSDGYGGNVGFGDGPSSNGSVGDGGDTSGYA